jgi:hypothetical protein
MPIPDDAPEPESAADETTPDPDRDVVLRDSTVDDAYQAGFMDGRDVHEWIKSALAVLGTDLDAGKPGTLEHDADREMRVEASRMIARLFRGVLPDDPR